MLELCILHDDAFHELIDSASPLTQFAVVFRYPTTEPLPTHERSDDALTVAREVYSFVLARLPPDTHPAEEP